MNRAGDIKKVITECTSFAVGPSRNYRSFGGSCLPLIDDHRTWSS